MKDRVRLLGVLLFLFSIATLSTVGSMPPSETITSTSSAGYLTVNFDKATYAPAETVHITGNIYTPYCTWTYAGIGPGLAVSITITSANGILVAATTNQSAAGYKSYAYDYVLPGNAAYGSYAVFVSYRSPCGETVVGQGVFQVSSSESWTISVTTDKPTYRTGELIHINGTIIGGPYFACPTGSTCTVSATIPPIMGVVGIFNASGDPVAFQDLAFTPTEPPTYHFHMEIAGGLAVGAYSVDAEVGAVGYPTIHATTSFKVTAGTTSTSCTTELTTWHIWNSSGGPITGGVWTQEVCYRIFDNTTERLTSVTPNQTTGPAQVQSAPAIPGFPIESILAGLFLGFVVITLHSGRRRR
jgi:hypothetical protein